jgi:hypothetical protein
MVTRLSRRFKIPTRDYLCSILPGYCNRRARAAASINQWLRTERTGSRHNGKRERERKAKALELAGTLSAE